MLIDIHLKPCNIKKLALPPPFLTLIIILILWGHQNIQAQTNWNYVGIPGFSDGAAEATRIAFDAAGTPYVVYQDEAQNLKGTVKKFDGTSWITVGNAGFTPGQAYY